MKRFFAQFDPHKYTKWELIEVHYNRNPNLNRYLKEVGTSALKVSTQHPGGAYIPVPQNACVTLCLGSA
jgi:hypothetical protein